MNNLFLLLEHSHFEFVSDFGFLEFGIDLCGIIIDPDRAPRTWSWKCSKLKGVICRAAITIWQHSCG